MQREARRVALCRSFISHKTLTAAFATLLRSQLTFDCCRPCQRDLSAHIWIKAESASRFDRYQAGAFRLNLFENLFLSERGFGHFRDRCLGTVHRLDECQQLVGDDPQSNPMGQGYKSSGINGGISGAFFRRLAFLKGR
jgi:hypothetical protein